MEIDELSGRIQARLAVSSRRLRATFPFVSVGGRYQDFGGKEDRLSWWTNSFWAGLQWLMFRQTGDDFYRQNAEACETQLEASLLNYEGLHHDVGFQWSLTGVASFKLTGNSASRKRALLAASTLASRFNLKGGYIRAWNGDNAGWAIVDCLMNLPLLYWASEQTGDDRFAQVARAHADMALHTVLRSDGSVNHIVCFDPQTGEFSHTLGGQGYAVGSSWSRGQAWALYGFALSHRYTKNPAYLDAAKRVAHYFLAATAGAVPRVDFRAPSLGAHDKDSTAGAIAAAGLLEIADSVGELEAPLYRQGALGLLRALDGECCAWDQDEEALLLHGTHAYHANNAHLYPSNHSPIIYGDYYFAEAVFRLQGQKDLFW